MSPFHFVTRFLFWLRPQMSPPETGRRKKHALAVPAVGLSVAVVITWRGHRTHRCVAAATVHQLQHIPQKKNSLHTQGSKVKLKLKTVTAWWRGLVGHASAIVMRDSEGRADDRTRSFILPGREQTNNRAELLAAITAMRVQDRKPGDQI